MLSIPLFKPRRKARKYRIKRDEYGRSARRRAFDAFDGGKGPAEVSPMMEISLRTVCRYFADWKKLPKNLDSRYRLVRAMHKKDPEFSEEIVKSLAAELGMSEEEVMERLQKPWGLKQLLMGKWPNYSREKGRTRAENRLQAALELIRFSEVAGVSSERIAQELHRIRAEFSKHSEDEELAVDKG